MLKSGYTFLFPTPPKFDTKHLWIVLAIANGQALLVNVTSMKSECDMSCVLKKGDHHFILHNSVINYADAMLKKTSWIEKAIINNEMIPKNPVSYKILHRIKEGAKISDAFPTGFLDLI